MKRLLESRAVTVVLVISAVLAAGLLVYDTVIVLAKVSCEVYNDSLNTVIHSCMPVFVYGTALLVVLHLVRCLIIRRYRALLITGAVSLVVAALLYWNISVTVLYCFLYGAGPLNLGYWGPH
jgi:hypothetical protein